MAIRLGRLAGAAVVLGSATPSVESVGLARQRRLRPRRPAVARVRCASPTSRSWTSEPSSSRGSAGCSRARSRRRSARSTRRLGDQAILVLNRRGTASVVMCRDCGHVQACPDCERPLVYHQAGTTLRCHHCGRATPLASRCPSCSSPRIRYLGGGTERVEREVRDRFPALRVGRLDRDVVERRGAAERVIDAFTRRADRRPRRDEPRRQGPRRAERHARRRSSPRTSRSTCQTNAPRNARTSCSSRRSAGRSWRSAGPGDRPDVPTGAPGDRRCSERRPDRLLRRRAGDARAVRVAAVRADREADRRAAGSRRRRARGHGDGRATPRARDRAGRAGHGGRPGACLHRPPGGPLALERRPARARIPVTLLDGGPDAPWSVDVDPESLL